MLMQNEGGAKDDSIIVALKHFQRPRMIQILIRINTQMMQHIDTNWWNIVRLISQANYCDNTLECRVWSDEECR